MPHVWDACGHSIVVCGWKSDNRFIDGFYEKMGSKRLLVPFPVDFFWGTRGSCCIYVCVRVWYHLFDNTLCYPEYFMDAP